MQIVPMTREFAAEIVTWRYPAPYDCYDMTSASAAFLISEEGGFCALVDGGDLIGFRSFGDDGRVAGGNYDASALDTGGGLRPDLTGKGLGREAIGTGLAFGRREFAPAAFRVTVASFNERALRVVRSLGFVSTGSSTRSPTAAATSSWSARSATTDARCRASRSAPLPRGRPVAAWAPRRRVGAPSPQWASRGRAGGSGAATRTSVPGAFF